MSHIFQRLIYKNFNTEDMAYLSLIRISFLNNTFNKYLYNVGKNRPNQDVAPNIGLNTEPDVDLIIVTPKMKFIYLYISCHSKSGPN